ncbi:MAG: AmmeMemoRadiSam system protein B [Sedimentisphaerales bacterium]|nr:AmmeMemoRadiSam system protein B [Sedimentisphaerales bacterium]
MSVRPPAVAGQFYDASADACKAQISQMAKKRPLPDGIPDSILAAVVPHAGWVFSGDLAAMTIAAIAKRQKVDTFIVMGAVHTVRSNFGILYDKGAWKSPLGEIEIDPETVRSIIGQNCPLIQADRNAHQREHSIEVLVPMIQHFFPESKIVPIMVPPVDDAHEIGKVIGQAIASLDKKIVCLASTDLTHYGPSYGYTPMGTGAEAVRWAKDTNDKYFIDMALSMRADTLVESAQMYHNACGAGAVAAAVAAANELGAEKSLLLAHTTSAEVMAERFGREADDSVGYAAIVFGT